MKKACIFYGIGLIAAIVAYHWAIQRFLPQLFFPPSTIFAVLGGASLLMLFGAIAHVIQGISDKIVIARAVKNEPFRDGKRAAAIGEIHPSGLASITAPFSGRECLAYEYQVYELIRRSAGKNVSTNKSEHCSGYGMVPSTVRTPRGDIRILGFPLLDEWQLDFMEEEADRARANEYLSQTQFLSLKSDFGKATSEMEDLFRDTDGSVRKDFGIPVSLEKQHHATEIVVPGGSRVCAIGVYSKKDNALIAKTAALPIRLVPGNAEEAERRLRITGLTQVGFALAFFLILHGMLALMYFVKG